MDRVMTICEAVEMFLADKQSEGIAPATIKSYRHVLEYVWARVLDFEMDIGELTTEDVKAAVNTLARSDRSRNTIRSYTATMQTFLSWSRQNGLCDAQIRLFKGEETVPECYSADELKALLKRPNLRECSFVEYRCWVIVNLLVNDGCRASTVRSIRIQDVDLEGSVIYLRHMKRRKSITIPLGETMTSILRQYLAIRKGKPSDYLFTDDHGGQMSENCLRLSINRYNKSRGVQRTGLHKFRHTFARMFLLECGGDPLRLQKVLGHSTLKMTQHYARIYDAELVRDFRDKSPLDRLRSDKIRMPKK